MKKQNQLPLLIGLVVIFVTTILLVQTQPLPELESPSTQNNTHTAASHEQSPSVGESLLDSSLQDCLQTENCQDLPEMKTWFRTQSVSDTTCQSEDLECVLQQLLNQLNATSEEDILVEIEEESRTLLAPKAVSLIAATDHTLQLETTAVEYNEILITDYKIFYSTTPLSSQGLDDIQSQVVTIDSALDTAVQLTVGGLDPETTYYLVVSPIHPTDPTIEPLTMISDELSASTLPTNDHQLEASQIQLETTLAESSPAHLDALLSSLQRTDQDELAALLSSIIENQYVLSTDIIIQLQQTKEDTEVISLLTTLAGEIESFDLPEQPVHIIENKVNKGGGDNYCGDGVTRNGEECDDGNHLNGDGCDSNCQVEPTTLTKQPATASPKQPTKKIAPPPASAYNGTQGPLYTMLATLKQSLYSIVTYCPSIHLQYGQIYRKVLSTDTLVQREQALITYCEQIRSERLGTHGTTDRQEIIAQIEQMNDDLLMLYPSNLRVYIQLIRSAKRYTLEGQHDYITTLISDFETMDDEVVNKQYQIKLEGIISMLRASIE